METPLHKKLAQNEVIFRQANEKAIDELEEINNSALENGDLELIHDTDIALQFFCECSNEDCVDRIKLKPSAYQEVHQNSSQFIVLPGHNMLKIEKIVQSYPTYLVVEKIIAPPDKVTKLKNTLPG
jgi:hypothetical protein